LAVASPLALRPWDGGVLELSGVFGGWPSFSRNAAFSASSAATRAISAAICSACAWTWASNAATNASFSDDDSAVRSGVGVMNRLTHIPTRRATGIYW